MQDRIFDALNYAVRRDKEKGGIGVRSTRELADWLGEDINKVRRELNRLFENDKICAWEGGDWSVIDLQCRMATAALG